MKPPCYTADMGKTTVNLNVRMPADLHERLKRRAGQDMRSLNLEVIWLLALALEKLEESGDQNQGQAEAG